MATIKISQAPDHARLNPGGVCDIAKETDRWFRTSCSSLAAFCGDLDIEEIDAAVIQKWHLSNRDRISVTSANTYLRGVKTVFSRLVKNKILVDNPAAFVPFAVEPPPRPRAVSEATYKAMRAIAFFKPRDRAFLDLLWATGARLSGLLSMRVDRLESWRDAGGRFCFAAVVSAKGKSRYVYAADDQARSVAYYLTQRPPVPSPALFLTEAGYPLTLPGAYSMLRVIRQQAKIPASEPSNAHAFRHAFAIRMLDQGHDLATVAAWLGHADPAFTARVYAVRREDQLRAKFFK